MYFLGNMGKSDWCVGLPVGMSCYVSQLWTCNGEGQGATCRAGQEDEAYLYAKHLHCRGRYWRTWWLVMFVDSVDGRWNKMMVRHRPISGLQKSRSANTRQYFLQYISSESQVPPKTKFILLTKYPLWWSWVMKSCNFSKHDMFSAGCNDGPGLMNLGWKDAMEYGQVHWQVTLSCVPCLWFSATHNMK